MVSKLKTIPEKPHIKNAIKDIELEGGTVPEEMILIADEYADGKINGREMVRKIVENAIN